MVGGGRQALGTRMPIAYLYDNGNVSGHFACIDVFLSYPQAANCAIPPYNAFFYFQAIPLHGTPRKCTMRPIRGHIAFC